MTTTSVKLDYINGQRDSSLVYTPLAASGPAQGSIVVTGLAPTMVRTPNPLVIELLFDDGAGSGSAVNTGSAGSAGDFTISGSGTPSSIVASGGWDGGGYLSCPAVFDGGFICFKAYILAVYEEMLRPRTADFEYSMYCRFRSVTNRWGYVFWGYQNDSPIPSLSVETGTGKLYASVNGGNVWTGYTQAADNTWRQYRMARVAGVTTVYVNGVSVYSVADTTDYHASAGTTNTMEVGCYGNGAGGFSDADIDDFRFYNYNV